MSKVRNKVQWKSLTHHGPAFPTPYKRLPKTISLLCNSKAIHNLSDDAEEAAVMYSKILISNHKDINNPTFRENFFEDFRDLLNPSQRARVRRLAGLNFSRIIRHLRKSKQFEKGPERKIQKRNTERLRVKHGFCRVDGRNETIANWMVEPPGIFRGRGNHPDHGRIKLRITPGNVTINCSERCHIKAPGNSRWEDVIHDPSVVWLAKYTNNLGQTKYMQLNQSSKVKMQQDKAKYDLARKLGNNVRKIRLTYARAYNSRNQMHQQRAVALFFIDKFALRAGNEKGLDAADTVGCCTLRKEHIRLVRRGVIKFDFKGKDSITYQREVRVPDKVYNLIRAFTRGKRNKDLLFDTLNAQELNLYLKSLMRGGGLTCKVFRTFSASALFQEALLKNSKGITLANGTENELLTIYNKANLEVAKLCNHKKTVSRAFDEIIRKLDAQLTNVKRRLRTLNAETRAGPRGDRLKNDLEKLTAKRSFKILEKGFSLGTSKNNYIDPRISVAWCKKKGIPIDKVFSKTLQQKYKWATNTKRSFKF